MAVTFPAGSQVVDSAISVLTLPASLAITIRCSGPASLYLIGLDQSTDLPTGDERGSAITVVPGQSVTINNTRGDQTFYCWTLASGLVSRATWYNSFYTNY